MQWHFFLNLQTINACSCATFCGSNRNVCNVTVYFWLARGHSVSVITNVAVSYVVRLCLLCKSHRFNDFFLWNTVWKQCLPQQIFAQCTLKKKMSFLSCVGWWKKVVWRRCSNPIRECYSCSVTRPEIDGRKRGLKGKAEKSVRLKWKINYETFAYSVQKRKSLNECHCHTPNDIHLESRATLGCSHALSFFCSPTPFVMHFFPRTASRQFCLRHRTEHDKFN